jgi:cytidine deaminase
MDTTAKIKTMIKKAYEAMDNAFAPYSNFHVGACVEAEDGELFVGCNVENASYGLTMCAERVAIGNLIASGRKRIKSIAVIGSSPELCLPCGACRQVINEFALPDAMIYSCNENKDCEAIKFSDLLPRAFGFEHKK